MNIKMNMELTSAECMLLLKSLDLNINKHEEHFDLMERLEELYDDIKDLEIQQDLNDTFMGKD